jgi:hypothetical protein
MAFSTAPLKNLADGVARLMKSDRPMPTYFLFNAYVRSFPVDQVIATMNTPAWRKVLLNMYQTDVLCQHSGGDRELRGKLLEDEMGL